MSVFRSFINAHSALTAQARRTFSTAMYGSTGAPKKASCVNPDMLYLQPRWHVQKDQAVQGKVLAGMIQKRWNSAAAQPVELAKGERRKRQREQCFG
jgi:elongation factor G